MAESFGELLRRFRVAASLTQEALAGRCRISPATVAAIEQGRRKAPRLSTVRLIAEALELPPADLELLARAADDGGSSLRPGADHGDRAEPPGRAGSGGDSPGPHPAVAAGPDGDGQGAGPPAGRAAGLPAARPSFIGRDGEQAAVLAALAGSRMVTLVGPGGVGKTRLAAR